MAKSKFHRPTTSIHEIKMSLQNIYGQYNNTANINIYDGIDQVQASSPHLHT